MDKQLLIIEIKDGEFFTLQDFDGLKYSSLLRVIGILEEIKYDIIKEGLK